VLQFLRLARVSRRARPYALTFPLVALLLVSAMGSSLAATNTTTIITDNALGVRFTAPAGLYYQPAQQTNFWFAGQTTTARLSSYPLNTAARPSDFREQILIELSIARRDVPDLATIAATRVGSAGPVVSAPALVAGHSALRLDGAFSNGPRIIVLVVIDAERLLVVQAFPSYSSRGDVLTQVLGTLQFTGGK
jgi:hypothetical protein